MSAYLILDLSIKDFARFAEYIETRIQLTSATGGSIPKNTWFGVL